MKPVFTLFIIIACVSLTNAQVTNRDVSFNGTSTSKLSFGNITLVNGASKFTFEAWMYIDQWNENSYVFSKSVDATNQMGIQLGPLATKRLYFHVANNGSAYAAVDNSTIAVGSWHHIAMAFNGIGSAYNMVE